MILRLLAAIALITLAFFLINRLRQNKKNKPEKISSFKETVSCKKCKLRLPKQDAIEKQGEYYCCQEHSQKHPEE